MPDAGSHEGTTIEAGDGDNRIRYRTISTRGQDDRQNIHFVQALEGEAAFIQSGQAVPLANRSVLVGPYSATVQDSIEYHDVSSGFYVVPRLSGDTVSLEISPQMQRLAPTNGGVIDLHTASTTINGPLGTWIPLAGVAEDVDQTAGVNLTRTRRRGSESREIWVKVEEIEDLP